MTCTTVSRPPLGTHLDADRTLGLMGKAEINNVSFDNHDAGGCADSVGGSSGTSNVGRGCFTSSSSEQGGGWIAQCPIF